MRTPQEIQQQIDGLQSELESIPSWSNARETIKAVIAVLKGKATPDDYWIDDTAEEYSDGDNDTYHTASQAQEWLLGRRNGNLFGS